MKKSYIVIGVIIVIVIGIFMWFKGSYNQMVTRSENYPPNGRMWKTNINGAWI